MPCGDGAEPDAWRPEPHAPPAEGRPAVPAAFTKAVLVLLENEAVLHHATLTSLETVSPLEVML